MRLNFLVVISFFFFRLAAFSNTEDSLLALLQNKEVQDTNKVKTIRELTYYYLFEEGDIDKAIEANIGGVRMADNIHSAYWSAKMNGLLGYIKQYYANDYEGAIKAYFLSLNNYDKINNEIDKYAIYLNLGVLYYNYNQFDDAEKYLKNAVKSALISKNEDDLATAYTNLGAIYEETERHDSALIVYDKAKTYYVKINSEVDIAKLDFSIINMSVGLTSDTISEKTRRTAIDVYRRVAPVFKESGDQDFYLGAIINLGVQLTHTGDLNEGQKYLLEAEALAEPMRNYTMLLSIYQSLATNYQKRNDFENESLCLRKYLVTDDSLYSQKKAKAIAEVQIKYQTDKIEAANNILLKETKIQDLEISKKNIELVQSDTIKYGLIGGLSLIIIFTTFLFNRFKITNRQKKIIEHQKLIVEEKQKEITDSIKYAKRIQEAILPSRSSLVENLRDGFVLFKPKDVVSGDFYWLEKHNDTIYFAAADCTGHGVPGAMVSVVCSNALSKALLEEGITETGKLLDRTRELVIDVFAKSGDEVKDGMDISLCALQFISGNKEKSLLTWSGANNPLWIIRDNLLTEYKPDKQPIGKFAYAKPFTTQEIELKKDDKIFIFTDGYQDQFGGEKGKKFKAARLKENLLAIQDKAMEVQRELINDAFEKWRGSLEQVDDVCIIGVRV